MAGLETNVVHEIMKATSKAGARLFKNVRGVFLSIDGSRRVAAGLQAPGASDLVGFTPVTITADMVGKQVAVFTVIEAKSAAGRASPEQMHFIKIVLSSGGFAGIARSSEDAMKIIEKGV